MIPCQDGAIQDGLFAFLVEEPLRESCGNGNLMQPGTKQHAVSMMSSVELPCSFTGPELFLIVERVVGMFCS